MRQKVWGNYSKSHKNGRKRRVLIPSYRERIIHINIVLQFTLVNVQVINEQEEGFTIFEIKVKDWRCTEAKRERDS